VTYFIYLLCLTVSNKLILNTTVRKRVTLKYFLADWSPTFATQMLLRSVLRTDDMPPIVVIRLQAIFMTGHKQRYPFSRMLKDFDV